MRRRDFITAIGGVAAMPLTARAQQPALPVVGFLSSRSPGETAHLVAAFLRGLSETGHVDGQNVALEYRWAEGRQDRLPALVADWVGRRVAVISATGGPAPALAAQQPTSTIPIVFIGSDPVKLGLVKSLNRPGGNMTGVNVFLQEMEGKRLGLLRELLPNAKLVVALLNPNEPELDLQLRDLNEAARILRQQVHVLRASSMQDIDSAFVSLSALKPSALLVGASAFFNSRREQIVTLANHYWIPAVYEVRDFAVAGGLMSYGTSLPDAYRQVGIYTGRILKGEKPADLPVMQSTKFELVINLKTAKALGLEVPSGLAARADEIIE